MGSISNETYSLKSLMSNEKSPGKPLEGVDNPTFTITNEKAYILDKFLATGSDSKTAKSARPTPIPKPRTRISNKNINNEHRPSLISQVTYKVTKATGESPNSSIRSDGTFNVVQDPQEQYTEKAEIETLSDSGEKSLKTDETQKYSYYDIVEITIHKTNWLKLDSLVSHPLVKIHIMDLQTGEYLKKSMKYRPVVFFYENDDCDIISPVMTHAFDLQAKRTLIPCWEERILFNEDYNYLKDERKRIVFFFEILDFVTFTKIHQLRSNHIDRGWHKIAFAFLRACGKNQDGNDGDNLGKKVRLQLYHYPDKCDNIWSYWKKSKKLIKYPSSIYITIKSTPINQINSDEASGMDVLRSKTPTQREKITKTLLAVRSSFDDKITIEGEDLNDTLTQKQGEVMKWKKRPHEFCKVPNKKLEITFPTPEDGSFTLKFSHNGLYLACAVKIDDFYGISIISIEKMEEIHQFPSHQGLIYTVIWSYDDSYLVTCSADNTVALYDLRKSCIRHILPHPSFVYSCDYFHDDFTMIASGCYDKIVRIWALNASEEFELSQELDNYHEGYITCVVFSKNNKFLYSADCLGGIIEWSFRKDWIFNRKLEILDLKDIIINQIILFPKDKKLLVHSRDSTLRIVDLNNCCVLQWLHGSVNKRIQTLASISPCGSYVLCGGENGFVHVWNSKNGKIASSIFPYSQNVTISCVNFHPKDNLIAVCEYGKGLPVLIYVYDQIDQDRKMNGKIFKEKVRKVVENQNKLDFRELLEKMDHVITQ